MSMTATGAKRLEIGAVVSDTISVIQRNIRMFGLAALALGAAPNLLGLVIRAVAPTPLISATVELPGSPTTPVPPPVVPGLAAPILLVGVLALVLGMALQAALFYATARDLEGERTTLGEMIKVGFQRCLPLIGLIILAAIAIDIGFILLVVPGVLLLLRWCVAGPALAIEGKGVFASMKRSAELTKGRRWSLFLLWLIIGLLMAIIEIALLTMMGGLRGAALLASLQHPTPFALLMTAIVSPIVGMVFAIGMGAFGGVLYTHLRSGREGMAPAAVAEVFA